MLFSSITFIIYFFPIVFIVYYAISFSRNLQNVWLLLASLVFYAWGEPVYVFLMIGSILVNACFGLLLSLGNKKERKRSKFKKAVLIIAVAGNIGILFVFKYSAFLLSMFGHYGQQLAERMDLSLPIGISFYTFQALSYVIDVYRGKTKAANPFYVGLYLAFFPQLIAGPIVQYASVEEQIKHRKESFDMISVGVCRFATGLCKKILLANTFAAIADHVFDWSTWGVDRMAVPASLAWLGSISYSLQIYFDFSAYSDMAIGLALCFGFKFAENFNYPYIATSISNFWHRWHISLTDWFRNYVYIPLGGSHTKNMDTTLRNMGIVWLLTGIWHGANWTFLLWGVFYFVFLAGEKVLGITDKTEHKVLRRIYTLLVVNFQWVLFRSDDLYQAGRYYLNMLGLNRNGYLSNLAWVLFKENFVFLIVGIVLCTPVVSRMNRWFFEHPQTKRHKVYSVFYPIVIAVLVVLCLSYLTIGSYNPFIYFDF